MSHRYNLRQKHNTNNDSEDRSHQTHKTYWSTDTEDSDESSDESPARKSVSPKPKGKGSVSDQSVDSVDSILSSPSSTAGSSAVLTPSPQVARRVQHDRLISPESRHGRSFQFSPEARGNPAERSFDSLTKKKLHTSFNKSEDVKLQWIVIGCVVLSLIAAIFIFKIYFKGDEPLYAARPSEFQEFKNRVNELRDVFPSQDERTWKTLKASVRHVLDRKDPQYPAVVLFAVPNSASQLGTCFAQQVVLKFKNSTRLNEYIDCRQSRDLSPAEAKLDLDEKIQTHFQTGKAVVIDHLESLSPKSVLLLHGTCDNDNAPFKDVLISLVFHLDIPHDLNHKQVEGKVEEYLMSGLDVDKVGAMLSRIANNIVVVRNEQKELIDKVCL